MVEIEKLQHEGTLEKHGENIKQKIGSEIRVQTETKGDSLNLDLDGLRVCKSIAPKVQDLFVKLEKLRSSEDEQYVMLRLPTIGNDDHIGVAERDSAVTTMKSMQRFYNYGGETLATAVNYLDRFLSKVKVKRRYLSCVTAASFFLSTKMHEEEEYHPRATDLASLNRHCWQPSDLKRMEKIILDKLDWNMFPAVTCLSYLQVIYQMLKLLNTAIDMDFFNKLVDRSELYMNYTTCATYNACTLAMCVTQQCLKEAGLCSVINKYVLLNIQAVCQITDSELFDCHCAISKQLQLYNRHPQTRPKCLPLPKIVPRPSLVKRPSFYGTTDLPTIEEDDWSSDSSEEEDTVSSPSYIPCQIVSYFPYTGNPTNKLSQSYCLLLDQCNCTDDRLFYCIKKCNTSIS